MRISDWSSDVCSSDLHALETELARTIGNLQQVRGARIHLAIPKPSAFASKNEAPSASVFIELYSGRTLEADQVASIVHLVASSVPGLLPAAVTVIDQFGHLLTNEADRSEEHTSELQSLMRISYAVFCLKKKNNNHT